MLGKVKKEGKKKKEKEKKKKENEFRFSSYIWLTRNTSHLCYPVSEQTQHSKIGKASPHLRTDP